MPTILQGSLPVAPWMAAHTLRLPGTVPAAAEDWLLRDDAFAAQMAYRDHLIATRPAAVHAMEPGCAGAAAELLHAVLDAVATLDGYRREAGAVVRPDGVRVPLDGPPLLVAGRLVQEDLLILERDEGAAEHRLTGGILCFPSNWTLAEKMGKGLVRIHLPVEPYDADIARRVQRLFDGLRPGVVITRANLILYGVAELWNPRREWDRHRPDPEGERFIRVERQCLVKLAETGAVVFTIHTFMVRPEALTEDQREGLLMVRPDALGGPPAR
jgi:dimethylamine monooxygenase subunit A